MRSFGDKNTNGQPRPSRYAFILKNP